MKRPAIIIAILFAFAAIVPAQQLPFSLRKMYIPSAETQEAVALLDEIISEFTFRLAGSPEYEFTPVEVLQTRTPGIILDDFDLHLDPAALLRIEPSKSVNLILFFYVEKRQSLFYGRVTAKEFPSGVFIHEAEFLLDVKKNNADQVVIQLETFVQAVKAARSDFGYSFHKSEQGVLFVTDSYENRAFIGSLRGLWRAKKRVSKTGNSRLAVKTVFYYFEGDSNYVDVAKALLRASGARAVLIQSEHSDKQIAVLPFEKVKPSVMENTLPVWPPFEGFTTFPVRADSLLAEDFGVTFSPGAEDVTQILGRRQGNKSPGAALVFYNTIRTLEKRFYNQETPWDEHALDNMSALYNALTQSFETYKPEIGWIGLNHGEFLYRTSKYESALEKLQASLAAFDAFSNQFGPLFVQVLRGQVYEETHDAEQAVAAYQAAVALADNLKDDRTLAWLYYQLGALTLQCNRSLESWSYFGLSAEKYMSLGDTKTVVTLYTKIGVLLRQNTLLLKSRDYLQQALDLATTLEDDRLIANAAYHLAVTEEELQNIESAQSHFERAGDLMEILADSLYMASVEEHIGDILMSRQQWRSAQGSFEYATRYYQYIDDFDGVIRCLVKSADASVERRKWQRAQNALDEALALANRRGNREWASIILQKKGVAHINAGNYAAGEKELELANSASLSREDVERYMKSLTRDLEVVLDSLQPERRQ